MKLNKFKEACRQVAKLAVAAYTGFNEHLYKLAMIEEAENRLASVSRFGHSFVFALQEFYDEDLPDTYISIIDEATEMIAAGVDEPTVLHYFDLRYKNERM